MQRMVSFMMPDGSGPVRERFSQTTEYCVKCGHLGTWTNGHCRVCAECRAVVPLSGEPYRPKPTEVFDVIASQLKASSPAN